MRKMRWIAYLWPGLPQLWTYGTWSGLIVALGAAALLDLLLVVSFGWSELLVHGVRTASWVAFGVVWVVGVAWSVRQTRRRVTVERLDVRKDAFPDALDYYLKGDYYQAEHVLVDLLRQNLRDIDARLMLATLMRHTGRLDEAERQLDTMSRFEGAGKWELEMGQERERLTEAKADKATAA